RRRRSRALFRRRQHRPPRRDVLRLDHAVERRFIEPDPRAAAALGVGAIVQIALDQLAAAARALRREAGGLHRLGEDLDPAARAEARALRQPREAGRAGGAEVALGHRDLRAAVIAAARLEPQLAAATGAVEHLRLTALLAGDLDQLPAPAAHLLPGAHAAHVVLAAAVLTEDQHFLFIGETAGKLERAGSTAPAVF